MFKREMKIIFKNFIIWTLVLILIFLVVFLIYPSIVTSENVDMIDEMLKVFPPSVLKADELETLVVPTA